MIREKSELRFLILVSSILLLIISAFIGNWTISLLSAVSIVILVSVWLFSESLILSSFSKLRDLKQTPHHILEKEIQKELSKKDFGKVKLWVTSDRLSLQFYCLGSKNRSHIVLTETFLQELEDDEVIHFFSFAAELYEQKHFQSQQVWVGIILLFNLVLNLFDRIICFFIGLNSKENEARPILRKISTLALLKLRGLSLRRSKESMKRKNLKALIEGYSYLSFTHVRPALKPLSVIEAIIRR